ncbi:MAG: hypothetical protein IJ318_00635 [Clostridia bacterium]|nr:hypothetical protein [Clostridia bacterium]
MIKRVTPQTLKGKIKNIIHTLADDLKIYMEAFENTTLPVEQLFGADHRAFNELSFLLKFYLNRKGTSKKELIQLKKLLDEYTTVEWVGKKACYATKESFAYRFSKFAFPKEIQSEIDNKYKEATQILHKGNSGQER